MHSSAEHGDAVRDLEARRRELLHELAAVEREIQGTKKQMARIEGQLAVLTKMKAQAA